MPWHEYKLVPSFSCIPKQRPLVSSPLTSAMAQPYNIYRSGPTVPADIVTYRHNEKLVYVKPAETYEVRNIQSHLRTPQSSHLPRAPVARIGHGPEGIR